MKSYQILMAAFSLGMITIQVSSLASAGEIKNFRIDVKGAKEIYVLHVDSEAKAVLETDPDSRNNGKTFYYHSVTLSEKYSNQGDRTCVMSDVEAIEKNPVLNLCDNLSLSYANFKLNGTLADLLKTGKTSGSVLAKINHSTSEMTTLEVSPNEVDASTIKD